MHNLLEIHQRGRVLRLALNRPEKRNALNAAMCLELVRVIEDADRDPAVGAIVLAGNGKAFCAGMDLSEIEHGIADTGNQRRPRATLHHWGAAD